MSKEQRERLKELDTQGRWTLEELMELDRLKRVFYKHYQDAINDFEDRKI